MKEEQNKMPTLEDIKIIAESINANTKVMEEVVTCVTALLAEFSRVTVYVEGSPEAEAVKKTSTPEPTPKPEVELTTDDITISAKEVTTLCVSAVGMGVDKNVILDKVKVFGKRISALSPNEMRVVKDFILAEVKKVNDSARS